MFVMPCCQSTVFLGEKEALSRNAPPVGNIAMSGSMLGPLGRRYRGNGSFSEMFDGPRATRVRDAAVPQSSCPRRSSHTHTYIHVRIKGGMCGFSSILSFSFGSFVFLFLEKKRGKGCLKIRNVVFSIATF